MTIKNIIKLGDDIESWIKKQEEEDYIERIGSGPSDYLYHYGINLNSKDLLVLKLYLIQEYDHNYSIKVKEYIYS